MKNKIISICAVLLIIFSLTACDLPFIKNKKEPIPEQSEAEVVDSEYPVIIGDIEIKERPQAVVSLSPAITEKIYDLDLQDTLVGVSDYTSYPQDATDIIFCGTSMIPNTKLIKDLKADLVLCNTDLPQSDLESLEKTGIQVVVVRTASTMDEVWENYSNLAQILGGKEAGKMLGDAFVENIKSWYNQVKDISASQETIHVAYLRELEYTFATGDTVESEIMSEINMNNIASAYSDWKFPEEELKSEQGVASLRALNRVFIDDNDVTIQKLEQDENYRYYSFVIEDRYTVINPAAFERQGLSMFAEIAKMVESCWEGVEVPPIDGFDISQTEDNEEENPEENIEDTGAEDEITDPNMDN